MANNPSIDAEAGQPRSRLMDACVLLVLVPAWLVCLALSVREAARDTPFPVLRVQYSGHGVSAFPIVLNDDHNPPAGALKLRTGDRLLRWNDASLAGKGLIGYFHIVETRTPATRSASVVALRDGREFATNVDVLSHRVFLPRLLAAIVFLAACLTLRFRAAQTPVIRSFEYAMWGGAFLLPCFFGVEVWLLRVSWVVSTLAFSVMAAFWCRAFQLLLGNGAVVSGWSRMLPWACALLGPLDMEREFGLFVPQSLATMLSLGGSLAGAVYLCASAARAYRKATPIERRKIKWVVWGVHVALTIPSLFALLTLFDSALTVAFYLSIVSIATFPIALLIAALRFNLFDVDRVISHTAFYSTAAAALIVALVGLLPQLTSAVCPLLDLPVVVVQLGFSLMLVIAGVLGHRSIVPAIERRLHPERFAFEAHVSSVINQLRAARSPSAVFQLLSHGIVQSLAPVRLGMYLRGPQGWNTVFSAGPEAMRLVRDDCQILSTAARTGQIINVEGSSVRRSAASDDSDRRMIAELGLALVVPLHWNQRFIGVVLIGRKTSGDIYVASECALLLALAQVVSQRLATFEWQSVMADVRRGRDALRRYVPAAIAREIARGVCLGPEEREVSLLFVDIRGYSCYAEGRSVSDVFSTVNHYTQIISSSVAKFGGSVVEFNGDGMMVVFGAPRTLANKEMSAVEAALHIHASIGALRLQTHPQTLSVGVGIATGIACVGSVRAVDRLIWTAIGETTNRASRLQSLTRDLQAEIVIDQATWNRIGPRNHLFVRHGGHTLRGLRRKHELFIKPLPQLSTHAVLPSTPTAVSS